MKKYNIKGLILSDIVVNCKTRKQAKNFLKYLHSKGYTWETEHRLLDRLTYFDKYLDETCFELTPHKTVMFASIVHFKEYDYKIITLKDIKIKKEKKR